MHSAPEETQEAATVRQDMREGLCLRDMPEGTPVRVREVRGCRKVLSRLCALGITPGAELTLCGRGEGGCRVQVRDTCIVLDRDCAESILCVPPRCTDGRHGHHACDACRVHREPCDGGRHHG
ncbi:ferrous iron transport protein A [Desulfovibrio sp. OttesenSCG-928-O18]|nr:ferrous iron transport protein A [Desulfovibrio sp. OttesenSCG-928-O18]